MTTPSRDIFDRPEYLLRIWESEKKTLEVNASLIWENVKHFGGFISGLLVPQIVLLSFVWNIHNPGTFPFDVRESIFIFPIAMIVLTHYAEEDLRERWKRFLLVVTHLLKLEDLLGLHEDITSKLKHFKEDKYLFVEYQSNLAVGKSQTFIMKSIFHLSLILCKYYKIKDTHMLCLTDKRLRKLVI